MGMPVRIAVYAQDERAASAAARAAFAHIASLEDRMSDYRVDSEVRRLELRPREWVPVSAPLYDVLARAIEIAQASDGAFDPTVGPLVQLWREARRTGRLPSRAAIQSARERVCWRYLSIDSSRRVRLDRAGMRLDLGGIAKGYILQSAVDLLRTRGVKHVMIEAGGDIVVGDPPPGRRGWRIETPGADTTIRALAGQLARASISTSGPSEQFIEIDGVRYSHVIDPRTGDALTRPLHATVIASDGATADALSTALTVLDASRHAAFLARFPGVAAGIHERP